MAISIPVAGLLPEEDAGHPLRFQAGGTLRKGSIYVERPADEELPKALARGEFCYVLTTRQMGKSSLCVRTMGRLRSQGLACASIDLTGIGSQTSQASDWYYGLLSEIALQLGLDPPDLFWDANKNLGPVHTFSRYLEHEVLAKVAGRVIIFIDEIDSTLALPFSRDDFFASVRALYNRRAERSENERLTFCLLGVAAPGDLIADPARTPFNIGRAIRLEDFTRQQMEVFHATLVALGQMDSRSAGRFLDEIFEWTAGHPYMTQRVCDDLSGLQRAWRVDEVVRARFLVRGRIEDANLHYAEKCFGHRHDDRRRGQASRMLHLYRRLLDEGKVPADAGEPIQVALQLTGMAAERSGAASMRMLTVRNRVFGEVFDAAWVQSMEGERAMAEPLARWMASKRSDEALPTDQALADLQQWAEGRDDLTPEEQMFLRACIRVDAHRREVFARQRGQRILIVMMAVIMLLLLGLLYSLWSQYRQVEKEAKRATQIELQLAQVEAERLEMRKQLEIVQQTERARMAASEKVESFERRALPPSVSLEAINLELRAALERARQAEAAAEKALAESERASDMLRRALKRSSERQGVKKPIKSYGPLKSM
jgi:hypothetical protein